MPAATQRLSHEQCGSNLTTRCLDQNRTITLVPVQCLCPLLATKGELSNLTAGPTGHQQGHGPGCCCPPSQPTELPGSSIYKGCSILPARGGGGGKPRATPAPFLLSAGPSEGSFVLRIKSVKPRARRKWAQAHSDSLRKNKKRDGECRRSNWHTQPVSASRVTVTWWLHLSRPQPTGHHNQTIVLTE